ncbi:hypothetical protein VE04_01988 [Pseudogymnoascus sp. 24MN13]|nr:hypothetical protein VE04_01988 [Pseudogymnoascus sp. 24MN13]
MRHQKIPNTQIPGTICTRVHSGKHHKNLISLCATHGTDLSRPSHLISSPSPSPSPSSCFCARAVLRRPASIASAQTIACLCVLTHLMQHPGSPCAAAEATIQQWNITSPAAPEAMTLRALRAARQRRMSCILPTDQFTSTHRLGASGRFRSRVHISRRSVSQTSRSVPTTVQPPLQSLRGWPIWVAVSRAAAVLGEETTASCRTHCDGIGETIVCGERKVG